MYDSDLIYSHKFSVLDLFIWIFGEIDDSKIIHLKDHIDQLTERDSKLINIDFLIKSEHSIEHLCTRNIYFHFQSFFAHDYFNLMAIVRKSPINTRNFKYKEEEHFKGFLNNIQKADQIDKNAKPKLIKEFYYEETHRPIFFDIDYTKCFNIAVKNQNSDIAKFVILLLRFFFLQCPEDRIYELRSALNKFNHNLLKNFHLVFEPKLYDVVEFLLDIRKLDELKRNSTKLTAEMEFLVYDRAQFNAKQLAESIYFIKEPTVISR